MTIIGGRTQPPVARETRGGTTMSAATRLWTRAPMGSDTCEVSPTTPSPAKRCPTRERSRPIAVWLVSRQRGHAPSLHQQDNAGAMYGA